MNDPRVARLGELVVNYSLGLQPGKVLRIDAPPVAAPLAIEIYRAALAAGAHPYVDLQLERLPELLLAEANDEQLEYVSPIAKAELELVDAIVTIWSESNTRALTHADPERHQRLIAASQQLAKRRWQRMSAGELGWFGVLFPTEAHAQDAEMSLDEYERFVFRACHVEEPGDPVAHWEGVREELRARADALAEVRELRIVGPGHRPQARRRGPALAARGRPLQHARRRGLHEPARDGHRGRDQLHLPGALPRARGDRHPAALRGRRASSRRRPRAEASTSTRCSRWTRARAGSARWPSGSTTRSTASRRTRSSTRRSAARCTSRSARPSRDLGGRNESALHWDLVCDLREDGEVYADGELVWRAGRFLETAAPARV